ncbi:MAG: phage portal protein [Pseudomonadota bacterium]
MPSPANAAHASGRTIGGRAAYLVANSPHAAAIANAFVTNIVADGPTFRPQGDEELASAFLSAFWPDLDVEGGDFGHLLQRIVRSWIVYGEAFVHLVADPDSGAARAQLINPDQVDRSVTHELANGGRIKQGVEQDRLGLVVAFHILPDAQDLGAGMMRSATPVPAADVLHLFDPHTPGQRRGVSLLAPVLTRLVEIDALEDAQLATAKTQALVGIIFRTAGSDFGAMADAQDPLFPAIEPGASIVAPPGYDADLCQPARMDGANDFLRSQLRSAAAGVGVPYALMTGDLSDTNYSSARLGLLEFRRRVVAIQKSLLVPRILDPLWARWATLEQLAGRLPRGDISGEWVFPGWQALDPLKETQADAEAIRNGLKSRFEVIASRGRDPQEVDRELAEDSFAPRTGDTHDAA